MSIQSIAQAAMTVRCLGTLARISDIDGIPFSCNTLAHTFKQVNQLTD